MCFIEDRTKHFGMRQIEDQRGFTAKITLIGDRAGRPVRRARVQRAGGRAQDVHCWRHGLRAAGVLGDTRESRTITLRLL